MRGSKGKGPGLRAERAIGWHSRVKGAPSLTASPPRCRTRFWRPHGVQPFIATNVKEPTPEPAASEIDAKTHELMHEFLEHVQEVRRQPPGDQDARKIFEAWAIQKIAALQYTVLQLGAALAELHASVCTHRGAA